MQALVFSPDLPADDDTPVILPLPVAPGSGSGAVRFVSLDACPRFFDMLERVVSPVGRGVSRRLRAEGTAAGCFDASYLPTIEDFAHLDPRWRRSAAVWRDLGRYQDYGFAVFTPRPGPRSAGHPIALWFRTRDAERLFFPTVQVHGPEVPAAAALDHVFYYQRDLPEWTALRAEKPGSYVEDPAWSPDERIAAMKRQGRINGRWHDRCIDFRNAFADDFSFDTLEQSLGHYVMVPGESRPGTGQRERVLDPALVAAMQGLVNPAWHVCRHTRVGTLPNDDTWVADGSKVASAP